MSSTEPRPGAIRVLVGLMIFQGFSGVVGGCGLTFDATGSAVGLDRKWLEGSPFRDYLVPGVILLLGLGIGPLAVAFGILWRSAWAWFSSVLVGVALIVWIIVEVVEVLVVGYISHPPLQLLYGLVGIGIVAVTTLAPVRRHLKASGSPG